MLAKLGSLLLLAVALLANGTTASCQLDDQQTAPVDSPPVIASESTPRFSNPPTDVFGLDQPVPCYSVLEETVFNSSGGAQFELPGVKLGWFANAEIGPVQPFIHTNLNSGAAPLLGPGGQVFPGPIQLPIAQPTWSALPRFEVGYRFEKGLGELRTAFRFLSGQGGGTVTGFDPGGAASLTSRLRMDTIDIDFSSYTEFSPFLVPKINPVLLIRGRLGLNQRPEEIQRQPLVVRWMFGLRMANVFFDSQLQGPTLSERTMNNFTGAGIHAAADFTRSMPWKSLALYSKVEVSGLAGKTTQTFSGTQQLVPATGALRLRPNEGVPVLGAEIGMSYNPNWRNRHCRVIGGYQIEQWWCLGQTSDSFAELTLQGMFLRGELGF